MRPNILKRSLSTAQEICSPNLANSGPQLGGNPVLTFIHRVAEPHFFGTSISSFVRDSDWACMDAH